ncbi:MAG: hypothetical protein HOH77_18330 [Candidatus Latescibacteria bacterium]|jgi:hypothetical protein|nr:hypothetical protein [Candidatus Latescibacterota bacterium]
MANEEQSTLRDAFKTRVQTMFQAEAGNPLNRAEKRPPLKPGRGNYVRHYSFSICEFAARCFYLDEQITEANAALVENAQHYLDHPKDINDRDSFHWHIEVIFGLIERYGTNGTLTPGRLTPQTETKILEPAWLYAKSHSKLNDAETELSKTWHVWESENHHVQIFTTTWHFAKLAQDRPEYHNAIYDDGGTLTDHYNAWTAYIKAYCAERAKKGLFIEMQNDGYNGILLKGLYNVYDFSQDEILKTQVRQLMDLYWAYWAQEQIDGVIGGGRTRIYQGGGSLASSGRHVQLLAYLYFGLCDPVKIFSPILSAAFSDYHPPAIVTNLALDVSGRGTYEIHQRPLGLVKTGFYGPPDYRMRTDYGGIHRYTYCTPQFIIGTPLLEARPMNEWAMISSQNRWHGIIFKGHRNARIVPQCQADDDRVTFNQQWSAQQKGTLICQKLKTSTKSHAMRVWFSDAGLSTPKEIDGWTFVESNGAYAAVHPVLGNITWQPENKPKGQWMVLENEWSPIILEVAQKEDYSNFETYQQTILTRPINISNNILTYTSAYNHTFTFYIDQTQSPKIDKQTIDYAPPQAFDSPFLQSDWNSGIVTIQKDKQTQTLNFNHPE